FDLRIMKRRITTNDRAIQLIEDACQHAAHMATANDADADITEGLVTLFQNHRHGTEHIFHHSAGIAAGRAGKGNASPFQPVSIDMICTNRGRADETDGRSFEQRLSQRCGRPHGQDGSLGLEQILSAYPSSGQLDDMADTAKEGVEKRHVLISYDGETPGCLSS